MRLVGKVSKKQTWNYSQIRKEKMKQIMNRKAKMSIQASFGLSFLVSNIGQDIMQGSRTHAFTSVNLLSLMTSKYAM